jgi:hypothetical protein
VRIPRIAIALLAASALAGCNLVLSDQPWFGEADSIGAPTMRDGLWLVAGDPSCKADETRPIEFWPECAAVLVVRGEEHLEPQWTWPAIHGKPFKQLLEWQVSTVRLATGSPLILQSKVETERADRPVYRYFGIAPGKLDEQGRLVSITIWPVQCGRLEKQPTQVEKDGSNNQEHVTRSPFPGLTLTDENCTAQTADALRAAARASAGLSERDGEPPRAAHWVREGWR